MHKKAILAGVLASLCSVVMAGAAKDQPNIIFIMVGDAGIGGVESPPTDGVSILPTVLASFHP